MKKSKVHKKRKDNQKIIAIDRIKELFRQAGLQFTKDAKLSDRYVQLSRKLSLKYKVPFTKTQKTQYCKKCGSFLRSGINARTRVRKGKIIIHCNKCRNIMRFLYK